MNIDFSKGIEYWLNIIKQFADAVDDLLFTLFGIHLFSQSEEAPAEEETTA